MSAAPSVFARRREIVHLLDSAASNPNLYLQDCVELLRDMLTADVGIVYQTAPRLTGGLDLELCNQVGISPSQMEVLRRLFAAGSPLFAYDTEHPEAEQRNRVISLRADATLDSNRLRQADEHFRQHGSSVYGQHRVLVCDGQRFLARVGVYREGALSTRERRAFQSLVPHFVQMLRVERLLRAGAAAAAGLSAVIERLEGVWVITTATGTIEYANASARAALANDSNIVSARIRNAIARRHELPGDDADISEIRSVGMAIKFLIGFRAKRSAKQHLEDASRAWRLTPRQSQVLAFVVNGRSNKEIASDLECAERTVEAHLTQLFRASETNGRAALISRFWTLV